MTVRSEEVPEPLSGERLDRVVAMVTGLSRATSADLVKAGAVAVDGEVRTTAAWRLRAGDRLAVTVPDDAGQALAGDPSVEVRVVHSDEHIVVVDKPAGSVVHPGAGHSGGTLVQGLLSRFPEMAAVGEPDRPGVVHRLDKGTSGLLVFARTPAAYDGLVAQMAEHRPERRYQALAWGHPADDHGLVDAPIGRSHRDPTRMVVSLEGRPARTWYEVEARHARPVAVARLACRLETGRTHQVRVHLAAIGHPVVGDGRYGGTGQGLDCPRPFLHAAHLGFDHPVSGRRLAFDSPLPPELCEVLDRLD